MSIPIPETKSPPETNASHGEAALLGDGLDRNRFAFTAEIKEIVPVSDMTLWRWTKAGKIPAPVYIGNRRCWHLGKFLAALGL